MSCEDQAVMYEWRGQIADAELDRLHALAFDGAPTGAQRTAWTAVLSEHSLGWVVARQGGRLVGFVNTIWDGGRHAWLQDTMVTPDCRGIGIGTALVAAARVGATKAGCEWLHVDFDDGLRAFYVESCGFRPTSAGLLRLR